MAPALRLGFEWIQRGERQVQRCRGCGVGQKDGHAEHCALRYPQLHWLLAALPLARQGDLLALRWSRCSSESHVRLLAVTDSERFAGLFSEERRAPYGADLELVAWDVDFPRLTLAALAEELASHFAAEAPDGPAGPGYQWEQVVRCDPAGRPCGLVWVEVCEGCRTHAGLRHAHTCPNNPDREQP